MLNVELWLGVVLSLEFPRKSVLFSKFDVFSKELSKFKAMVKTTPLQNTHLDGEKERLSGSCHSCVFGSNIFGRFQQGQCHRVGSNMDLQVE